MTRTCLLLALVLQTQAHGRPAAATTEAPVLSVTGAFFALSVADLKPSSQWYTEKLGLRVVMQTPKTDKAAATILEGGGLMVELIQHEDAVSLSQAAPQVKDHLLVHGLAKAGVVVTDFAKTLERLKQRGVHIRYGPFPARANQRANVIVEDNAGNLIQLFGQ